MASQIKIIHSFLACLMMACATPATSAEEPSCEENGETHIWISPLTPKANGMVKIMAVSTGGPVSELSLIDSQGRRQSLESHRRGGPPWSLVATAEEGLEEGDYRVLAGRTVGWVRR